MYTVCKQARQRNLRISFAEQSMKISCKKSSCWTTYVNEHESWRSMRMRSHLAELASGGIRRFSSSVNELTREDGNTEHRHSDGWSSSRSEKKDGSGYLWSLKKKLWQASIKTWSHEAVGQGPSGELLSQHRTLCQSRWSPEGRWKKGDHLGGEKVTTWVEKVIWPCNPQHKPFLFHNDTFPTFGPTYYIWYTFGPTTKKNFGPTKKNLWSNSIGDRLLCPSNTKPEDFRLLGRKSAKFSKLLISYYIYI